jgi:Zn ribbon nucleic-acid-binding protein
MTGRCPRCNGADMAELQRLNPAAENRVYRCRRCGHLWSPIQEAVSIGSHDTLRRDDQMVEVKSG